MPGRLLFDDPRPYSPTAVPGREAKPFLVQVSFENELQLTRRIAGAFSIQQVGAMCDEEVGASEIVMQIQGSRNPLDQKYLGRIWPALFKLPFSLLVDREEDLQFYFPGRAVVVIAGVRM